MGKGSIQDSHRISNGLEALRRRKTVNLLLNLGKRPEEKFHKHKQPTKILKESSLLLVIIKIPITITRKCHLCHLSMIT